MLEETDGLGGLSIFWVGVVALAKLEDDEVVGMPVDFLVPVA